MLYVMFTGEGWVIDTFADEFPRLDDSTFKFCLTNWNFCPLGSL